MSAKRERAWVSPAFKEFLKDYGKKYPIKLSERELSDLLLNELKGKKKVLEL